MPRQRGDLQRIKTSVGGRHQCFVLVLTKAVCSR